MITLSVNYQVVGKGSLNNTNATAWQPETLTRKDIVQANYYQAYAIAPATYTEQRRKSDHWLQSQLLIIDIDSKDNPDYTYEDILNAPITKQLAFAAYPSSSFDGRKASAHILIELDTTITNRDDYEAIYKYIVYEYVVHLKADAALGNGVQAVYGTGSVTGNSADTPFNKDQYLYFNESAPTIDVLDTLKKIKAQREHLDESLYDVDVKEYRDSHYEQPLRNRIDSTIDMLSFILKGYGRRDYHDDWLPLIFATYDSCSGDANVLEFICNHPDVYWHGAFEKQKFRYMWEQGTFSRNSYSNTPITVATLIHRAKLSGWLTSSPVELTDYTSIFQRDLTGWLQDLPTHQTRLLIKSNTGTGKTWAAIHKLIQLGIPRAVFFAPSIKLCQDLHQRIQHVLAQHSDIEPMLYIEDGKTKDKDILSEAHILVTTLQTFANKVLQSTTFKANSYGLVVVDESDKLISDFVTSGVGDGFKHLKSHVKYRESQQGITALRQLLDRAGMVIFLDGTATQISQTFMQRSTDRKVYTYVNKYAQAKANTYLVHKEPMFKQIVLKACEQLYTGKYQHIYIACDTRKAAEELYELCVQSMMVQETEMLLITQHTRNTAEVSDYFANVNEEAKRYKVVVYSPTLSSGVSIESIHVDAVLQHCTFLNPSDNLQSLNRVRDAKTCYVYRRPYRNLYHNVRSHTDALDNRRLLEQKAYGNLDFAVRTVQAQLTEDILMLVLEHHHAETRDKLAYYQHLLQQDKRNVYHYDKDESDRHSEMVKSINEELKHARSEVKDYALKHWRYHDPVEDLRRDEHHNNKHLAASVIHSHIKRLFIQRGEDYYLNLPVSDEHLAQLAQDIGFKIYYYDRVVSFAKYVDTAIKDMINKAKPRTNITLIYTQAKLFETIHKLIPPDVTSTTYEDVESRAETFVYAVGLHQDTYDSMVSSARQKYDYLSNKYANDDVKLAIALLDNLLKLLGLKKKKSKRDNKLSISNAQDLLTLYNLRFDRTISFNLTQGDIDRTMVAAKRKVKDISSLTALQYSALQDVLGSTHLSLEDTINSIKPVLYA